MSASPPHLKPMSAGDILDQAIRIYRQNFISLVTIVAIISVPLVLIQLAAIALTFPSFPGFGTPSESFAPADLGSIAILVSAAAGILALVAAIFQNGALSYFVSERFLNRPVTVRQAYGKAFSRWLSLLLAAILLGLAVGGVFALLFGILLVPVIAATVAGGGSDSSVGFIVGILLLCQCGLLIPALIAAVYLYTRWTFWVPAIVIENYNSTGGLGRSWKLVKGTFWRVLGFNIILYLIVTFFSLGPTYLVGVLTFLLPSPLIGFAVNAIASSLILIIMTPLQYAVLTVLYYDLRIRKEGFDLVIQMQAQETASALPSLTSGSNS